jgi:hypothetical protein
MSLQTIHIPGLNTDVRVQDRASLRSTQKTRKQIIPVHKVVSMPSVALGAIYSDMAAWPTAPTSFMWAPSAVYGLDGNGTYGNCQLCAGIHSDQLMTLAATGVESQFDQAAIIAQYLQVTGGLDIGWNEFNLVYQWENIGLGGNPDALILDSMDIDPTDTETVKAALWFFGSVIWNGQLAPQWLTGFKPGETWNAGAGIDTNPNLGHAVILTGVQPNGNYGMATWGASGYFEPAAVAISDPDIFVNLSWRWFNRQGYAPNGAHYTAVSPLWTALGGRVLPASPFPPPSPTPVPTPTPTPPATVDVGVFVGPKQVHIAGSGWTMTDNVPLDQGRLIKINCGARTVHGQKGWTQTATATGFDVGIDIAGQKVQVPNGWSFSPVAPAGTVVIYYEVNHVQAPIGWIKS